MPANANAPTISPQTLFLRWASDLGLLAPAETLLEVLAARTSRIDYLRIILRRVAEASPIFESWEGEDQELCGIGRLATALRDRPEFLSALPGRETPPSDQILGYFHGQAESHYLYICLTVRDPRNADDLTRAWIGVVRAWLLVHSIRRLLGKNSTRRDALIAEACMRLRMACEGTDSSKWLFAFARLVGPTEWLNLRHHIQTLPTHVGQNAASEERDHLHLHRLLGRIASDEARPLDDGDDGQLAVSWAKRAQDIPKWNVATEVELAPDEQPALTPVALTNTDDYNEEDDDSEAELATVDPEESLASQELTGRYIQLLSGADARYLAWDWYGLTPPETKTLHELIESSISAPTSSDAELMGAMVSIAVQTGRSLGNALRISLIAPSASLDSSSDWALDIQTGHLVRPAPRRAGHWTANKDQALVLAHAATQLRRRLDTRVQTTLHRALESVPLARTLSHLWPLSTETPLQAFRTWLSREPGLRRLTQGMLSQQLGRDVFARTGDHVLARLLTSSPASGLPASTAYAAYGPHQLKAANSDFTSEEDEQNVAGSLLDPLSGFLRRGFAQSHERISTLASSGSIIEYHNALTHYWDATLRAATGIRPFAARWLTLDHVDEQLGFIVIDDKPGIMGSKTRLVPFPEGLLERFRHSYIDSHCRRLFEWLGEHGVREAPPPTTAPPGKTHGHPLNFLFLLRLEGQRLLQIPVGEAGADFDVSPEAPLPRRTYRHWLRTQLHRDGAEVECVDSMFGHQDGATATHGDYSMRVWREDASRLRPILTRIHSTLEIAQPPGLDSFNHFVAPLAHTVGPRTDDVRSTHSGPEAGRWLLHLKAARAAAAMLSASTENGVGSPLGTRLTLRELCSRLSQLESSETLEKLGHGLVQTRKGTPATLGLIRYAFFLRLVERAAELPGARVRLRKRLFFRPKDESPYRHASAGALCRRSLAIQLFESVIRDLAPSKVTVTLAAWIAVLDLGLYSRLTDQEFHRQILEGRKFRIVRLLDSDYLEWNPVGEVMEVDSPIQRVRITPVASHALLQLLSSQQRRIADNLRTPAILANLVQHLTNIQGGDTTFGELRKSMSELVDQCNAIELPGMLGAFLAGRVRSASLRWGDWTALRGVGRRHTREMTLTYRHSGQQAEDKVEAPISVEVSGHATSQDEVDSLRKPGAFVGETPTASRTAARKFFAEIREVLAPKNTRADEPATSHELSSREKDVATSRHSDDSSNAGGGGVGQTSLSAKGRKPGSSEASQRREVKRAIETVVSNWSGSVSSACLALGEWCANLLYRKYARELIRISTVSRYFSALSPRFQAAAADADLTSMESDDIEDLYFLLVSLRRNARRAYPVARLREFHRFLVFAYGCPEIDWSEIASEEASQLCSPGLVDERAFGHLLIELSRSQPLGSATHRLAAQAFVILAFRAGLRSSEALGLSVDDLRMESDLAWVSVDKNGLRRLKSFSARRTIPMPHLRGYEARVLRKMLRASVERTRGRKGIKYLFAEDNSSGQAINLEVVKRSVNSAIKVASGQDHLTTHHLRHSFANRLFLETEGAWVAESSWARAGWSTQAGTVRRIVGLDMDAEHASRRSPWILARLLGHAHPRTSLLSYVHLLSDAAEMLIGSIGSKWRSPPPTRVIDLGTLPLVNRSHRPTRPAPATLQGADVLSIISDLNNGVPFEVLPGRYPIRFGEAERLARVLRLIEGRLPVAEPPATNSQGDSTAAGSPKGSRKTPMARSGIMSHILESRLPVLRAAIAPLYSADARRTLADVGITEEEFVSLFGSRRNICMFEAAQFQFVAEVVAGLDIARHRRRLSVPDGLNARVVNRAVRTGWLRREDSGDLGGGPVAGDLVSQEEPDKVIFEDERKPMHVALSILRDDSSSIGTRWELALMLIVIAPLLRFEESD